MATGPDGKPFEVTNDLCEHCIGVGDGTCKDDGDTNKPQPWCKTHCKAGTIGVKMVETESHSVTCVYFGTDKKTEEEFDQLCEGCTLDDTGTCVAAKKKTCHRMCFPEVAPTQVLQPSEDKDSRYAGMEIGITIPTNVPFLNTKVVMEFAQNSDFECSAIAAKNQVAMKGGAKKDFTPGRCRHGVEGTVGLGAEFDFGLGSVEVGLHGHRDQGCWRMQVTRSLNA